MSQRPLRFYDALGLASLYRNPVDLPGPPVAAYCDYPKMVLREGDMRAAFIR